MDGANDATEQEKQDGRNDQVNADNARDDAIQSDDPDQ